MDVNPYETPAAAILSTPKPLEQPLNLAWTAAAFLLTCVLGTSMVAAASFLIMVLVLRA